MPPSESPTGPKSAEAALSPAHERELRGLALMLADANGFKLAIATFASLARREAVIRRLALLLNEQGTTLSRLELTAGQPGVSLLHALKRHLNGTQAGPGRRRAVTVTGLENLIALQHTPGALRDEGLDVLTGANLQRDAFAKGCPVPVVLWLTLADTTAFAQEATDLWHWRSGTFDFSDAPLLVSAPAKASEADIGFPVDYSSPAQLLERRKLLEDQLSQLPAGPVVPDPRTLSQKARLLGELGRTLRALLDLKGAAHCFREQLSLAEASGDAVAQSAAMTDLAELLFTEARFAEAEPLLRRVLAIDEKSFGSEHPNVARSLNNLAQLLKATNRLAEAEPLMRRALAIDEKSFGPEHPKVAIRLNNLAQLLQGTNRLAEAEPLMRRALAIWEKSFGPEHPNVAIDLNNLAQLLQATNRLAEAEPLMRRALAIDEQSFGPEHPKVAIRLNNLAQLLQATNRLAEAEPLMRRAVEIREKSLVPDHPWTKSSKESLAIIQAALRQQAQ